MPKLLLVTVRHYPVVRLPPLEDRVTLAATVQLLLKESLQAPRQAEGREKTGKTVEDAPGRRFSPLGLTACPSFTQRMCTKPKQKRQSLLHIFPKNVMTRRAIISF
jgi:hypothetical protein